VTSTFQMLAQVSAPGFGDLDQPQRYDGQAGRTGDPGTVKRTEDLTPWAK
jgi:hypothetical protein